MHDLFTRGVTADGQLRPPREKAPQLYKESPLGWIPKEWDVAVVDDFCSQVVDCPHTTPTYVDSGIPCIRTADMLPGQLLWHTAYRVTERTYLERVARLVPRNGDIIYSREGERLGIASPVGDEPICLGQRVMLLRPGQQTDPSFMLWAMNTAWFYRRVVSGLGATTSPHVNVGDIRRQLLLRPPLYEQETIGRQITTLHAKFDAEETESKKLQSLKSGLMSELLTGCVDVAAYTAKERKKAEARA
jgi:type I restriction enzyme S subunit